MNGDPAGLAKAEIGDTAQVLKMWRELARLNQRELADLAGLHYTTISDYETGKTVPKTETVARVSAALGMTATDREATESFVHTFAPKLRPTRLEEGTEFTDALSSSTGEFAVWRKEIAQTVQDGSRFLTRLFLLLFELLIRIAEAVAVEAGPGKPDARDR